MTPKMAPQGLGVRDVVHEDAHLDTNDKGFAAGCSCRCMLEPIQQLYNKMSKAVLTNPTLLRLLLYLLERYPKPTVRL